MTDMSGSHEGPCLNYEGQKPEHYDQWDSCYLHLEAARRRKAEAADLHDGLVAVARRLLDGWKPREPTEGELAWRNLGSWPIGWDAITPAERRALDHLATQPTEDQP